MRGVRQHRARSIKAFSVHAAEPGREQGEQTGRWSRSPSRWAGCPQRLQGLDRERRPKMTPQAWSTDARNTVSEAGFWEQREINRLPGCQSGWHHGIGRALVHGDIAG